MPVVNRIASFAPDMRAWRRHLHQRPETGFDCHETAAFVAARLREFGVDEVHEGIARTGVVALIRGAAPGPAIGLRADMDALPILERTGAPHASRSPGKMHACGHDGHTTMLLGAARYLAETRSFAGTAVLIFQPAEEDGNGADAMLKEGVLDRWGVRELYALHNAPGTPVGQFFTRPGPIMAAVDTFTIHVQGRGGHGAMPHETRDPVVAACGIVQAIQTIASRNHHALQDLVVSVTQVHAGSAHNIIPDVGFINGTVRTFDKAVQAMVRRRMAEIAEGQGAAFGVTATLTYEESCPATVNDAACVGTAAEAARDVAGAVVDDAEREMGAEDFSFMLAARPGAYLFIGNGDSAGLHHPAYDFDDEAAPAGASFFARVTERALPLEAPHGA